MANNPLTISTLGDKFVDYRDPIWGDSYNWSWNRQFSEVEYLVIHHTVTAHDATPDDIALLHKARGWGGIGYHFLIAKDGTVYYVGDIGTARANVLDMNEKVVGISMIGDFTQYLPTDEQIISCHKLCAYLLESGLFPNCKTWDKVVGHKELQATSCPGSSWDKTQSGDMWWRIKTGTQYTPITPPATQPVTNYEALWNQSKTEFANYKNEVKPKLDLLGDLLLALNTTTEKAIVDVNETIRLGDFAKGLFTAGVDAIKNAAITLLFPDNVETWKAEVKRIGDEAESWRNRPVVTTPVPPVDDTTDTEPTTTPSDDETPDPKELKSLLVKLADWFKKLFGIGG